MLLKKGRGGISYVITVALIVLLLLWLATRTFGQTDPASKDEAVIPTIQETKMSQRPVFSDYNGVKIGTPAAQVLSLLEKKPRFEDKDGYFFVFSNGESAQFVFDAARKVKIISITYSGKASNAPTYADIFGGDVPLNISQEKIYKVVNYPEAGFWVSYYSSTGDNAVTTVTVQKLLSPD
ncbi:MAG: hypothetical protein ABL999_00925 [Pyrinomonadaceae bacterium]